MHGPYTGLKIVELGRFIAAPYCGQLLADGGADVIKVEPLVGDDARRNGTRFSLTEARQYLNKNRGKRSIALQLSDPRIVKVVQNLLHKADVTIVNFRPGQGEKLGLDYATVARTNPRIVYAQNTAFGTRGPLAGRAGMDILLQAYTGMAPLTDAGPRPLEDPFVDYTAALLMAWGIATALYNRERTGQGQKLDVSLLQAALVIQNNSIHHVDAVDGWRKGFVEHLKTAFAEGRTITEVLERRETLKPSISPPYYGFFETKDGYVVIGAGGRGLQVEVAREGGVDRRRQAVVAEVLPPVDCDLAVRRGGGGPRLRHRHADVRRGNGRRRRTPSDGRQQGDDEDEPGHALHVWPPCVETGTRAGTARGAAMPALAKSISDCSMRSGAWEGGCPDSSPHDMM